MKKYILSLLIYLFSTHSYAFSDWTDREKVAFAASSLAIAADWATTRDLPYHYGSGKYETNPILGRYPSKDYIDLYFVMMLVTNYYIADYLGPNKEFYMWGRTIVNSYAAHHNHTNIGLRFRF